MPVQRVSARLPCCGLCPLCVRRPRDAAHLLIGHVLPVAALGAVVLPGTL
jgi:hypothetical protein